MTSSDFQEAIAEALMELDIVETKSKQGNNDNEECQNVEKVSEVKVPQDASVTDLIRLEKTDNTGFGIFAARDIPRGTRILSESPLMELPSPGMSNPNWTRDVLERFEALSEYDKKTFMDLHCQTWKPLLQRIALDTVLSGEVSSEHIDVENVADIQDFPDGPLKEETRVLGTFQTNAFGLWGENLYNAHVAVFQYESRINHSCMPNTWHSWNAKTHMHNVHATRVITAGEEITIQYADSFDIKETRKKNLDLYGFECRCDACISIEAEERRAKIQYLKTEELSQFQQQLEVGGPFSYEDVCQALDVIEQLLELVAEEGSVVIHQEEL
ncbi:MAG: hypothetical protein Q9165_003285 [Trypethelium subeluteriae]